MRKDIDFYLGWILFFIAVIIFSSLVLEAKNIGFIGTQIVEFLQPLIGKAGLWLLWLMIMALSLVFILDDDFSPKDLKVKGFSLAPLAAGTGKLFSGLRSVLKKIFTNPFSSPALEDEMMPVMDQKEEKPKKTRVKRKPAVKKTVTRKTLPKAEEKISTDLSEDDDPIMNEILELEHEFEETLEARKKHSKQSNTSGVEIVEELEENSKLMEQIDKGKVAKPKNFKLPKLDFLQKAPRVAKKINEAEIDRKIEELLLSAEYIMKEGNERIILCERGIRTFETATRNTLDIGAVPVIKRFSHLPVIIDPSHSMGDWHYIKSASMAAIASGADGLIVEIHPDPLHAKSDGKQSLKLDNFKELFEQLVKISKVLKVKVC